MPSAMEAPTQQRVGGNYTAVDNGNGTFSITDLPIFCEVPAGAKRNAAHIGKDWMVTALEKNRLREQEGHLAPVHVYHSDETAVKPSYAGKLRLKRLGQITYEGAPIHALFADIVDIPKEVFAQIQRGFLPYRSVEVHSWDDPEIDSLALMPTDVPFFRMAMTTIGRVVKKDAQMVITPKGTSRSPASYLRCVGPEGALILFRFATEEKTMPTTPTAAKIPDKGSITTKKDGDPGQSSGVTTGKIAGTTNNPVEFEVEGTAPGGTEEVQVRMEDVDTGGVGAQLLELLQKIADKLGVGAEQDTALPPDDSGVDSAPVPGMRAGKPKAVFAVRPVQTVRLSERSAEAAALRAMAPVLAKQKQLEAKLAARERAESISEKLSAAIGSLDGYLVDEETTSYFRRCAEVGDDMLSMAVDQFKRNTAPETPSTEEEFERLLLSGPQGEAVNAFAAKHPGPKSAEWVRAKAQEHQNWVDTTGSNITLDEYLDTNWKHEGMSA